MAKRGKPKGKGPPKARPAPWADGFKPKAKGPGGLKRGGRRT